MSGMFTLQRNYTHVSLTGHVLNFKKNDPVYVPPECRKEVMQIGAIPDEGEIDILGPEGVQSVPLTIDERETALAAAFEKLVARNGRTDFTGQGLPATNAVASLVPFEPTRKEIEVAWRARQAKKATAE